MCCVFFYCLPCSSKFKVHVISPKRGYTNKQKIHIIIEHEKRERWRGCLFDHLLHDILRACAKKPSASACAKGSHDPAHPGRFLLHVVL